MSTKIIVPGYELETGVQTEPALQDFGLNVKTEHAVRISEPKRGKADYLELDGAEDDDVVEIELEYGVREWVRVEHLRQRLQQIDPKLVDDVGTAQQPRCGQLDVERAETAQD